MNPWALWPFVTLPVRSGGILLIFVQSTM